MKGNITREKFGVSERKAKTSAIVNTLVYLKVKFYPLKSFNTCMTVKRKMIILLGGALNTDTTHLML